MNNEFSLLEQNRKNSSMQRCVLKLLRMNNRTLNSHMQKMFAENPFLSDEDDENSREFFVKKHGQMRWMDEPNKIENIPLDHDFENVPIEIPDIVIEIKGNYDLESYINDFFPLKIFLNEKLYQKSRLATKNDVDLRFIEAQFNSANLLIKSINFRNFILLKIMKEIAYRQTDFLLGKREDMIAISTNDVAISLVLSENLIKKAIEDKIVQTPRGFFPLCSMFANETLLPKDAYAVKKYINQLINDEPKNSPYSDDEIACFLNSRGISLSCRAIRKYRNNLNIPNLKQRNKIYELIKFNN